MSVKAVRWKGMAGRYLLSLEWKRLGVMDNDSGDDVNVNVNHEFI